MSRVRERRVVDLPPDAAFALWTDVVRWPTFVEGFAHAEHVDEWPERGAKLVWRSIPGGRGTVTERVTESLPPGRFVTQVHEERLEGVQTVTFQPGDEGTVVEIELDYRVVGGGPLQGVTDALFVRRAQRDALARTLRRFAAEATEEASL